MTQGEHQLVRVEGLYTGPGINQFVGQLVDNACSDQSTRVELELQSDRLKRQLLRTSRNFHQARVTLEGDFYGSPVPDQRLPEAILKVYHPGWDYNSKTKLVVHKILDVKAAPRANAKP